MHVIINLNKPPGLSSQQAVTKVKHILGVKKAGHTGTLDPMATGVLLVCLNEATKIARFLTDMDKEYQARVKLGEKTDTYDAEGRVVEKKTVPVITLDDLNKTVTAFTGKIIQKAPMYSAVKVGGETLYKLARKGIAIERPDREVHVYDIKITGVDLPYFDMAISCSKGTYIRTICDDIGVKFGTGAHLVSLERTRVGPFHIRDAAGFDDLLAYGPEHGPFGSVQDRYESSFSYPRFFCPLDEALADIKAVSLEETDYKKAMHGMKIPSEKMQGLQKNEFVKLYGPSGIMFGIGVVQSGFIKVERILNL